MLVIRTATVLVSVMLLAPSAAAQRARADSARADSLRSRALEPVAVSATRTDEPLNRTTSARTELTRSDISFGQATLGLDESLALVPGVFAANRYTFALDQRISIR